MRSRLAVLILLVAVACAWPSVASAGDVFAISVVPTNDDVADNGDSASPSVNANGRFVAFHSDATNVITGDGNGVRDVFVRDLETGTTTRVSVDTGGVDANFASADPSIDAKGRYVAFMSFATDLIATDGNAFDDIFVRDLKKGTTVRASVAFNGGAPNGTSSSPSISANGRYVAFVSTANNLILDDSNTADVFVRDLKKGTTALVSADKDPESADLAIADGASANPSIDGKGRKVAFESGATDLVEGDGAVNDIFVRDIKKGVTTTASLNVGGTEADSGSSQPSIASGGRFVAFASFATDLTTTVDAAGFKDIFIRDLKEGTTILASVDDNGGLTDGDSSAPSIDAKGECLAFHSDADDLFGSTFSDVFVRDLVDGGNTSFPISAEPGGFEADEGSFFPSIAAKSGPTAFHSDATDLDAAINDGNANTDVFARKLDEGDGTKKCV